MVLVLCELHDTAALWAVGRLQERGISVDLVTAPALGSARRWDHRVDAFGASIEITLGDGRRISSSEPTGVLNRLTYVPTERLARIAGTDRGYAIQEMNAFFMSWLQTMPGPMLNRPTPQGLGGAWRHPSIWAVLATQAGLPTASWRQSSADMVDVAWQTRPGSGTMFVVQDQVVGTFGLPHYLFEPCQTLAKLADTALLGIDFAMRDDAVWEVTGASPLPDLTRGGDALADTLASALA